ncbi:hypothetical protein SLE2022_208370 [Rubroshorea leprosula]
MIFQKKIQKEFPRNWLATQRFKHGVDNTTLEMTDDNRNYMQRYPELLKAINQGANMEAKLATIWDEGESSIAKEESTSRNMMEEMIIEPNNEENIFENDNYNDSSYWENMTDEEWYNIKNMMEK